MGSHTAYINRYVCCQTQPPQHMPQEAWPAEQEDQWWHQGISDQAASECGSQPQPAHPQECDASHHAMVAPSDAANLMQTFADVVQHSKRNAQQHEEQRNEPRAKASRVQRRPSRGNPQAMMLELLRHCKHQQQYLPSSENGCKGIQQFV